MATETQKRSRRITAILLAFVAAAGLVVAALGNRWLAGTDNTAGIGLLGNDRCTPRCTSSTNFEMVEAIDDEIAMITEKNLHLADREQLSLPRAPWHGFPVMGLIAFGASLLAAAGLLVAAVLAIGRKRVDWKIMPTSFVVLGLLAAIVCGPVFVATKPEAGELMGVGWSFMTFGIALVLGLASVFPLNRQIRPIDEELGAASATMSWGGSRDD